MALTRLLTNLAAPAVVAVEGGWGTGKTAYMKMSAAQLRLEGTTAVEVNAWTETHRDAPHAGLTAAAAGEVEARGGASAARRLTGQAMLLAGSYGDDGLGASSPFDRREATDRFRDRLRSAADAAGGRLVVFVDDLDRCRPDHALGVLEAARFLFEAAGVIVVIPVHLAALEHAVQMSQGPDCDAGTYLHRLVDVTVPAPATTHADSLRFFEHLLAGSGLEARLQDPDRYTRNLVFALAAVQAPSLRAMAQAVSRAGLLLASIEPLEPPEPQTGVKASSGDPATAPSSRLAQAQQGKLRRRSDPWADSDIAHVREQFALTLLLLRDADRSAYDSLVAGRIDGSDAALALAEAVPALPPVGSDDVVVQAGVDETHVLRMQALLLCANSSDRVTELADDAEPRYSEAVRGEDWAPAEVHLRAGRVLAGGVTFRFDGAWEHVKPAGIDVREMARRVEFASFEPIPPAWP